MASELPTILMQPDWDAPSPLWPQSDETDSLVPPELLVRLERWQETYNEHCNWEKGWDSPEVRRHWAEEGELLTAQLTQALAGKALLDVAWRSC